MKIPIKLPRALDGLPKKRIINDHQPGASNLILCITKKSSSIVRRHRIFVGNVALMKDVQSLNKMAATGMGKVSKAL